MKELDHPNVVRALDVFNTKSDVCIVMKYFSNGTVLNFIMQRPDEVVKYMEKWVAQLVSAVNYLHRRGILHRD